MITKLLTIAIAPGFEELIEKVEQLAIEKQSNKSAVSRDILCAYFGIKPTPRFCKHDYSNQIKKRSGRKH